MTDSKHHDELKARLASLRDSPRAWALLPERVRAVVYARTAREFTAAPRARGEDLADLWQRIGVTEDIVSQVELRIAAVVRRTLHGQRVDTEDICAEAFRDVWQVLQRGGRTTQDYLRLAGFIAHKRVCDFFRKRRPVMTTVEPPSDPEAELANEETAQYLIDTLRAAAGPDVAHRRRSRSENEKTRDLVERWIEGFRQRGAGPSLRSLGKALWPSRPQTANDRWHEVTRRARLRLREQCGMGAS